MGVFSTTNLPQRVWFENAGISGCWINIHLPKIPGSWCQRPKRWNWNLDEFFAAWGNWEMVERSPCHVTRLFLVDVWNFMEISYQNNYIGSWIWWRKMFLMIAISKLGEVWWNVWLKVNSNEGKWIKDLYFWNWSVHITQEALLMVGNCVRPAWRIEHTWIYILNI